MTLQEALKAMQTHRVRHRYFDKEEWVTKCTNGLYYFEDGINFTEEEFLLWADKPYFKEGWEIIPNPEKECRMKVLKFIKWVLVLTLSLLLSLLLLPLLVYLILYCCISKKISVDSLKSRYDDLTHY